MGKDDTTAGLMKRLMEATAGTAEWAKARAILDVSSRAEVIELLAQALATARDELTKAKAAMAVLVHTQSEHAILTTDSLGTVVSITPEGPNLLGWPIESILGRPIDVVLADRSSAVTESSAEMEDAALGKNVYTERAHVRKDGTTFNARHAVFALIGKSGYTTGFVRRIEDVTAREAHEVHIQELDATIALLLG
jgi:PAS domain S-box-containing protein